MKYCTKCGKSLTKSENYCPQCGYQISRQKNVNIELVILAFCILMVVLGMCLYHFFCKKQGMGMSVRILFHNEILNSVMDKGKGEDSNVKRVSSEINTVEEEFQGLEEGSYKLITEDYEYLSGDITVINDYKDIAYADMFINIADETFYENFRWNKTQRLYETTDESKTCCFKVIQKNGQLIGQLQYTGKNYEFIFKKYNGLDGVNITLAVREYFEQKDDGIRYAFKTSDFQTLYAEIYMIPVFQVKNDKIKELYTVMVTSREYSKPGIARVYFSEDIKEVMEGIKELGDIEVLEEFDVYQFFAFEENH